MEVIKGISIFLAAAYIIAFINDIFKTALAKIKKTEYKWKSSGLLQDCNSWIGVLAFGIVLFIGFYSIGSEYARIKTNQVTGEMVYCDKCEERVPSQYAQYINHDFICPSCINIYISKITSGESGVCTACGTVYDLRFSGQYGMCEDCESEYLVPCSWCDEQTIDWVDCDIVLCPRCMNEAARDDQVMRAITRYRE